MKTPYEQIEQINKQFFNEIVELKNEIINLKDKVLGLEDENRDLKNQLKLNSKNSSKPPSNDYKKNTSPPVRKIRPPRKGFSRVVYPPERVDKVINCFIKHCPHCGSKNLKKLKRAPEAIQQVEIPQIKAVVSEYLLHKYFCKACGKKSSAKLPNGVPDSAFGPKLIGFTGALTGVCHLAKREAAQLIKDLFNINIGVGSMPNIETQISKALDPVYQKIHQVVIENLSTKHFDETGWRNSGKRQFAWVASCKTAAFYSIQTNRNRAVFKNIIRKDEKDESETTFPAVTDRLAVYNIIGSNHQYCLAHLIRNFRKFAESGRFAQRDGPENSVGNAIMKRFIKTCHVHSLFRKGKISFARRNKLIDRYKKAVFHWLEYGLANGDEKLFRLCGKLLNNFDKLWTFTRIYGMEPTNNLAERDLRKLVIWRKKSYGTRSFRGQKFVERITSVTETLKRHGKNVLSFIQQAVIRFFRNESAPFISQSLGI